MGALEVLFRLYLAVYGLGLAWHFLAMAAAAGKAPGYMRTAYFVASVGGFATLLFSPVPGALAWALVASAIAGGAALVVALKLFFEGVKVCEVMNHSEALKAAKNMLSVVGEAQSKALKDSEWLTPRSREYLWAEEDRERKQR
jgi:hypothetical protein